LLSRSRNIGASIGPAKTHHIDDVISTHIVSSGKLDMISIRSEPRTRCTVCHNALPPINEVALYHDPWPWSFVSLVANTVVFLCSIMSRYKMIKEGRFVYQRRSTSLTLHLVVHAKQIL
jgi:hypothetical protein